MSLSPDELRALTYCVGEVVRDRWQRDQVRPWLLNLMRRLELEVATATMSQSGRESDCTDADLGAEDWITARQAGVILNLSKRQTTRLACDLDGRIIDGRWLFRRSTVLEYAKERNGRHTA